MTFEENFAKLKKLLVKVDVSKVEEAFAFQFNITGAGEGSFYVKLEDGKLEIEPFDYHDNDATFIASADTFEKLVKHKLDPILAFTIGKLKVEGSLDKALKLTKLM